MLSHHTTLTTKSLRGIFFTKIISGQFINLKGKIRLPLTISQSDLFLISMGHNDWMQFYNEFLFSPWRTLGSETESETFKNQEKLWRLKFRVICVILELSLYHHSNWESKNIIIHVRLWWSCLSTAFKMIAKKEKKFRACAIKGFIGLPLAYSIW